MSDTTSFSDSFVSVFCSMSGLQQEGKTKIRVEPGLFEWTKWVSGTCLPIWIPPAELAAANLSVDTTYRYKATPALYHLHIVICEGVQFTLISSLCPVVPRPHIPISKLGVQESYDTYISRSFQVTREILSECKSMGKTKHTIPSILLHLPTNNPLLAFQDTL